MRRTVASIRGTGNEALAEMRRLVSVLRVADEAPLAPQPRIDALPALVEQTTAEGPHTTLSVTGVARMLPAGLDLAVYRIVQEALTNVRRHSGATRCQVCSTSVSTASAWRSSTTDAAQMGVAPPPDTD